METEYQSIAGKSAGEVARDIADFLSRSCVVQGRQEMDLANLLPDLTMKEQFSFAFLMEARTQGWTSTAAEHFYLRACGPTVGSAVSAPMLAAFREPDGEAFRQYSERYGSVFGLSSHAYWTACLAVAIDAKAISCLMEYLRAFIFCLMEFAYMDDRNPDKTYAWSYYETFQNILGELTSPPETFSPIAVRSVGGTAGERTPSGYLLSLGIDLQNPNETRMAWNVQLDITLKGKDGSIIATVGDQINCIDPGAVFHYGITRRIRGEAVSSIAATAKAGGFTKLSTPVMKHLKIEKASIRRENGGRALSGTVLSQYDCPLHSFALHYQFLSDRNKILGGGCEWFFEEFPAGESKSFSIPCPVAIPSAKKIVYSVDFNAQDLLQAE